jgi:single-strand DNA-binding protein
MYAETIIIGNVGRDAEMQYTPTGVAVTDFSVATHRTWTDADGERHERTQWYRVTCWRKLAETAAQYVRKGRLVLVKGECAASAFISADGQAVATLELTASTYRLLDRRPEGEAGKTGEEPDTGVSEDEELFS